MQGGRTVHHALRALIKGLVYYCMGLGATNLPLHSTQPTLSTMKRLESAQVRAPVTI
jgi:hypothetical protein